MHHWFIMSSSNHKPNTSNQPAISSFVDQKTPTHTPLVLINKESAQLKDTCLSTKRSNEECSLVKGNVSKKSDNKATPPKTLQLKLNKEDGGSICYMNYNWCGMAWIEMYPKNKKSNPTWNTTTEVSGAFFWGHMHFENHSSFFMFFTGFTLNFYSKPCMQTKY